MPSCSITGSQDGILLDVIAFGQCQRESPLLYNVGFVIIVEGLYASVSCDFDDIWAFNVCFLQLADCCFSCTVIREFLLTFLKGSICLYRFHRAAYGFFSHGLTLVVVQRLISFDTKVFDHRVDYFSFTGRFLLFCCRYLLHHTKFSRHLARKKCSLLLLLLLFFFLRNFCVVLSLFH